MEKILWRSSERSPERHKKNESRDKDFLPVRVRKTLRILLNFETNELVMDFLIEKGENTLHVLNAISPAFTSSMSFAS